MKASKSFVKYLVSCVVFAALFFTLGFIYKYNIPQIENWLLVKLEAQSRKHLPIDFFASEASLQIYPLGVRFSNIKFKPKGELKKVISKGSIDSIELELSWLALFQGKLSFSEINVNQPKLNFFLNTPKNKQNTNTKKSISNLNTSQLFETLKIIPVDALNINQLSLHAQLNPYKISVKTEKLDIRLENKFNALLTHIQIPDFKMKRSGKLSLAELFFETKFLITPKNIKITGVKLKKGNSYLVSSGQIDFNPNNLQYQGGKVSSRLVGNFDEITNTIKQFYPEIELPNTKGSTQVDLTLLDGGSKEIETQFTVKTNNFKINKYVIGKLNIKGESKKSDLKFSKLVVKSPAGDIDLGSPSITLKPPYSFNTKLSIKSLELKQLLLGLGLAEIPLILKLNGQSQCRGEISKNFYVKCEKSELNIERLFVHPADNKKTIVSFNDGKVTGSVHIDSAKVEYNAGLNIGESKGKSKGLIEYAKGFFITFSSNKFDFKSLENLSDLKFEGNGQLNGVTKGDGNAATLDLNANLNNVWFEDFGLGSASLKTNYKKGILSFKRIQGRYNTSRYSGNLKINLNKSTFGVDFKSNFIDLVDVKDLLSRRMPFMSNITGSGRAKAVVTGPLDISKLSYNANASFYRGTIFNENYDDIVAIVTAKTGNVNVNSIAINKGSSKTFAKGSINPSGVANIDIISQNLRLEESTNVSKLGLNLTGQLDVMAKVTDSIFDPNLKINAEMIKVTIANEPKENSKFDLNITKKSIMGKGNLFGKTLLSEFKWPISKDENFFLNIKSSNWDFIKMFNVFSKTAIQKNYFTNLNLDVNLYSNRGGFWNSSGSINIPEFRIERNQLYMYNPKPMRLSFKNGYFTTKNFKLIGTDTFTELSAKNSNLKDLNAKLRGKFELGLASILTPLEDINGVMNANLKVSGSIEKPKLLGSAYVSGASAKVYNFPHSFDAIKADVLFNDQQIIINAASGKLAGGDVRASGSLKFVNLTQVPIDVKGDFQNVSLKFPEGVSTSGSGTIYFKGDWFPYTLGGLYNIRSGSYTSEFDQANPASKTIRPSEFLPKFLMTKSFQPINLNLNISLLNPFIIKNSLVDASLTGKLNLMGPPTDPRLTGRMAFKRGGSIYFRDNTFELQRGSVEFQNSEIANPNLFMSAQTQIEVESDNINYDILLQVQGEAEDPNIKFSSTPPLKELDIVSLLALGVTTSELEQKDSADQLAETSYQIGSALLATPLGKQLKSRFGVDLQISSEQVGSDNSTSPKVTLKKQFSSKLSASASRTIGNETQKSEFKSEYKFNNNWSIIGFWDETENDKTTTPQDNPAKLGIDLEYKVQFK